MLVASKRKQHWGSQYQYIDIDEAQGPYHSSLGGDISSSPKWADTARNQHHQNHLNVPILKRSCKENWNGRVVEWKIPPSSTCLRLDLQKYTSSPDVMIGMLKMFYSKAELLSDHLRCHELEGANHGAFNFVHPTQLSSKSEIYQSVRKRYLRKITSSEITWFSNWEGRWNGREHCWVWCRGGRHGLCAGTRELQ